MVRPSKKNKSIPVGAGIIPQVEEFTNTYSKLTPERFDEALKALKALGKCMEENEITLPYPKGLVFLNDKAREQFDLALIDAMHEYFKEQKPDSI